MLTTHKDASVMGIIFPNTYDNLVPQLVAERAMAAIPFAGRYRLIDFMLSSMTNAGIGNISLLTRKNYHSLMEHLGSGREWDLARKHGGLNIVPPFAERTVTKIYAGRMEALASILRFLEAQKEKYVLMTDCFQALNMDFKALIHEQIESDADVTAVYQVADIPDGAKNGNYTLNMDETGRVTEILNNDYRTGKQNLCMNIYMMERERLISMIKESSVRGQRFFEREMLAPNLHILNVRGYRYDGYVARIADLKSFFDENMRLLQDDNIDQLFDKNRPIYTKTRDDNPTRYVEGAKVSNSMIADGCIIQGTVENSILFRGVHVEKGAVVRNCVLMQDTVVEVNANVEYLVTDKDVLISAGKKLSGSDTFPVYVAEAHTV